MRVSTYGILDGNCPINWDWPGNRALYGAWAVPPLSGWRGGGIVRDVVRGAKNPHDGTSSATWSGPTRPGGYGQWSVTGGTTLALPFPSLSASQDFYLGFWLYTRSLPNSTFNSVFNGGGSGGNNWALFVNNSGAASFGSSIFAAAGMLYNIALGWQHLLVTRLGGAAGTLAVYRNGVKQSSIANNDISFHESAATVDFGSNGGAGGSNWEGAYDDITLALSGLTDSGAADFYQETLRGNPNRWRWLSRTAYFVPSGGGTVFTLSAAPGSLRSAGSPAGLSAGRILAAGSASLRSVGAPSGLLHSRALAAGSASLRIAPSPAALVAGRMLVAGVRNLTLAGSSASLTRGQALAAGSGVLRLTGAQAALLPGRGLAAPPGMLRIVGSPAELVYTPAGSFTLAVAAGSLRLRGAAASLLTSRVLSAGIARLRLAPATASLTHGYTLAIAPGALRLRGGLAGFARTYALAAGTRRLRLAGTPASLNVSTAIFRKASITGTYTPARSLAGTNIPQRTLTGD